METSVHQIKTSVKIEQICKKVEYQGLKTSVWELKCSHNIDTIMINYNQNMQDLQYTILRSNI